MLFIILPKMRRHRWLRWLCNNSISLENGFGRRSNESLLFYTYIALNYIYRGLKYIHKGSQHAPILECQLTVVQRESKTWINSTGREIIQLQTTKVNKLSISRTRFFDGNLMTDLKLDRQKELKNGIFMLFPQVFGCAKNLSKFFCILHCHLSQSLRKILLIKLISITLCMSISSPESSASLPSFFLCNWCDSWDLVISSSSYPSLTVWRPWEMMSLMEWKSKRGYFGGLQGCNVF